VLDRLIVVWNFDETAWDLQGDVASSLDEAAARFKDLSDKDQVFKVAGGV